ncbi:MAG: queuosine precursor transporter [Chitinophagales bacterium]|nr:queuosine precursor transporter [Chitinophagales bacterium]
MITHIIKDKSTKLFIFLGGFFIANAFIAEVIGVKIFSLEDTIGITPFQIPLFGNTFSFNLTAGVLLWPVVFIMTDIINEYYGKKGVKFLSYLTVGLLGYAFFMYFFAIHLVPATWWPGSRVEQGVPNMQAAYSQVFGQGLAIILGSLIAFLIGQIVDVFIFQKIKKWSGEKHIWLRATGSTLVSQFIDSFVVLLIAFYIFPKYVSDANGKAWPFTLVMSICIGNYIYKFIVAIVLTPVIYLIHYWIEKYLGHELATEMKLNAIEE